MERRIRPSNSEFSAAINECLKSSDAVSPDTAMGPYAIYTRVKKSHPDWILTVMRIKDVLEDMLKSGNIRRSDKTRKYYLAR